MRRWTRCGLMFITFLSASRYSSLVFQCMVILCIPLAAKYSMILWDCACTCTCEAKNMIRVTGMYIQNFVSNMLDTVLLWQHCVNGYTATTTHWLKVSVCLFVFLHRNLHQMTACVSVETFLSRDTQVKKNNNNLKFYHDWQCGCEIWL